MCKEGQTSLLYTSLCFLFLESTVMSIELSFIENIELINNKAKALDIKNVALLYSTGVDSSCLLYLLEKYNHLLNFKLDVIYFNFKDIDNYEDCVEHIGEVSQVSPFKFNIVDIDENIRITKTKVSDIFKKEVSRLGYDAMITAHHEDDHIETILLKMLTRPTLYSLLPLRVANFKFINDRPLYLFKPLLTVKKVDIEDFCFDHGIKYIKDKTNYDPHCCKRNFLRNVIIPNLSEEFDLKNFLILSQRILPVVKDLEGKNYEKFIETGRLTIDQYECLTREEFSHYVSSYVFKNHGHKLKKRTINLIKGKFNEDTYCISIKKNIFLIKDKNRIYIDIKIEDLEKN